MSAQERASGALRESEQRRAELTHRRAAAEAALLGANRREAERGGQEQRGVKVVRVCMYVCMCVLAFLGRLLHSNDSIALVAR